MKSILRLSLCYLIFLLTVISCTGCGQQIGGKVPSDASNPQVQQENLNFRITWKTYSGRGEALGKIVDSYNIINKTAYKVNMTDGDEDLVAIETLLDNGSSADIYMLPYRYVQYLGYKNELENLTASFTEEKSNFYKNIWELGVVKEKLYGMPWLGHSMALIYNKELLEQAGVDPSSINSLEGLRAACQRIEENTSAKGIGLVGADHNDVSWMVNQFIYGFGGSLVSSDGEKVTINSKAAKEAIEFYRDRLGAYAQDTWTMDTGLEVMEYFRNQQVAFEIQGPWGVTDIVKNGNKFGTGVIALEDIGLNPEVGPMMLSLQPDMTEKKKEAAIAFINYLISMEAQEMIMDGEYSPEHDAYYPFRLPVRKQIADSEVFKEYLEFTPFLRGYNKPSIDVPVPLWQNIKDEYYTPGLHLVMQDKMTIENFLNQVQQEGDKILAGQE